LQGAGSGDDAAGPADASPADGKKLAPAAGGALRLPQLVAAVRAQLLQEWRRANDDARAATTAARGGKSAVVVEPDLPALCFAMLDLLSFVPITGTRRPLAVSLDGDGTHRAHWRPSPLLGVHGLQAFRCVRSTASQSL